MTTLPDMQKQIDEWVKAHGGYFGELTQMAQLTEEVGEVARIISRTYGEQSFKPEDKKDLGDELADVLFTLVCIANTTGVNLEEKFKQNLNKKTKRDTQRHLNNDKLKH